MRSYRIRSFASHQDANISDAYFLHQVEFFGKTFTVTALTFAGQYGAKPEVCAYEFVLFCTAIEFPVACCYEICITVAFCLFILASKESSHSKHCEEVSESFHFDFK